MSDGSTLTCCVGARELTLDALLDCIVSKISTNLIEAQREINLNGWLQLHSVLRNTNNNGK